jgi:urease accessory protein UreF
MERRLAFAESSSKMAKLTQLSMIDAAEWFGDLHPLAAQLGSADGLVSLGAVSSLLRLGPVNSVAALRKFLRDYHKRILFPLELPAIESAHGHALGNETRELIELDRQLAGESILREFAPASRRVGQYQLQKLRPLRDQRLVQRYLSAVEQGTAHGWHTLVYGVTLAIYSLPLRQGLLGYAQQTTCSFIFSAARPLRLSEKSCRNIFDELTMPFAAGVEKLLRKKATA